MHPLDNVIWQALTTRQSEFAEACGEARRFVPEITSLTAMSQPDAHGYASLAGLVAPGATALLSLVSPYEPQPGWDVVVTFPGLQMVCDHGSDKSGSDKSGAKKSPPLAKPAGSKASGNASELEIVALGPHDSPDMVELATLTKPGPFGRRTHELGTYLGIRSADGKLIAMAGERLKVPGFTEVSAVCTHPDHTGKGYARILMLEIMKGISSRGETTFLHVRQDNARAVELYERLGFRTRVVVHFTVLRRVT